MTHASVTRHVHPRFYVKNHPRRQYLVRGRMQTRSGEMVDSCKPNTVTSRMLKFLFKPVLFNDIARNKIHLRGLNPRPNHLQSCLARCQHRFQHLPGFWWWLATAISASDVSPVTVGPGVAMDKEQVSPFNLT